MKRLAFLVLGAALAGSVWAQTFAIRQPVEGARIRETYDVRIPARTVPGNAYIGIYINGKFVEAVRPEVIGTDFVYPLDTRKLNVADGPATIEAVLYVDLGDDRPTQVISRTSVNVTVDNSSSIAVPEGGIDLKYKFASGRELNYAYSAETSLATVSQAQALLGSRGFEAPIERNSSRFLFAVDNVYSNGDGMIRVKPLPDKNRDYGFIRLASEGNTVRKVRASEMPPTYMRMTNKGREIFGAREPYFELDAQTGGLRGLNAFLNLPVPILPTKKIKPGDVWQGAFSLGRAGVEFGGNRVSDVIPGRGTFEAVEYQRGVECARIRTSVASGAADLKDLGNLGFNQQNQSLRLDSVAWITIKGGIILRHEISLVQEALVDSNLQIGPAAGFPGRGGAGSGSGANGGSSQGQGSADFFSPVYDPHRDQDGKWSMFKLVPQQPPSGGPPRGFGPGNLPPGVPPGSGGRFMGGPPTNNDQSQQNQVRPVGRQIIRVSLNAVIELER